MHVSQNEKLTPMMRQYFEIKKENNDTLLFFRLGDFYEMFFDDAVTVSKELDLTLTGRDCGLDERAPMCGVPYHAAEGYINRLVQKGYKVAVCDQTDDSAASKGKGLVKREITRIVTAGTVMDMSAMDSEANNYIMSVYTADKVLGVAVCDVTTGEFFVKRIPCARKDLTDETARIKPKEMIVSEKFAYGAEIAEVFGIRPFAFDEWRFGYSCAHTALLNQFNVLNLHGFGLENEREAVCAAGALIAYLEDTQKTVLRHIAGLRLLQNGGYMALDISSRKNLEITQNIKDGTKRGSLFWVLNKTKTPMGARLLRKWLESPLVDPDEIDARYDAVRDFLENPQKRQEIRGFLGAVGDMERLIGRLACQAANARDLAALKNAADAQPFIKDALGFARAGLLEAYGARFDILDDISGIIGKYIKDDPPMTIREGGFVKEGADAELDRLRGIKENGASVIAEIEEREREETGIKSLKIRYNKVFGYCIEITNAYKDRAPARYTRRQTLSNCERYVTEELKKTEEEILGAQERIKALEYDIFCRLRERILKESARVTRQAAIIAGIDCIASFAERAEESGYTRPRVSSGGTIDIKDGRHPVMEVFMRESFIPNDTYLDLDDNRLLIITGSNMAGKSTYMRQTAVIVLMAQAGSYVPASHADIGVCDRIFTRVGASDDLLTGQSTFMAEMNEVANILNNATARSLLILDEIGRGTSTYDGLAIAWACLLHIADKKKLGARTMFATHYHELTELEETAEGIKNYNAAVKCDGGSIVFLRRIERGGAGRSLGVEVAKMAGMPGSVVRKAGTILNALLKADIAKKKKTGTVEEASVCFENEDSLQREKERGVIDLILDTDTDNLTPMRALELLCGIRNELLDMKERQPV